MQIMRPQNIWSLGKTVTWGSGAIQSTYQPGWAVDGIPGNPVRAAGASGSFTIAGTAGMVDCVVIANHNIWASGTVALSGDITASLTVPAVRPNRIPRNLVHILSSPVSVDSLTVTVGSNPAGPFIIGEVLAGLMEEWNLLSDNNSYTYDVYPLSRPDETELSSVRRYPSGREARGLSGSNYATDTQRLFMEEWLAGTYEGSRPSVIIPNLGDDPWVVQLGSQIGYSQLRGAPSRLYTDVQVTFTEYTRSRW